MEKKRENKIKNIPITRFKPSIKEGAQAYAKVAKYDGKGYTRDVSSFSCVDREDEVRKRLKIPSSHLIVSSLAIGKSNQSVCEIPRDLPENRFWTDYYGNC